MGPRRELPRGPMTWNPRWGTEGAAKPPRGSRRGRGRVLGGASGGSWGLPRPFQVARSLSVPPRVSSKGDPLHPTGCMGIPRTRAAAPRRDMGGAGMVPPARFGAGLRFLRNPVRFRASPPHGSQDRGPRRHHPDRRNPLPIGPIPHSGGRALAAEVGAHLLRPSSTFRARTSLARTGGHPSSGSTRGPECQIRLPKQAREPSTRP